MMRLAAGIFLSVLFCIHSFGQVSAGLKTEKTALLSALATDSCKLVFENKGFLYFVDYAESTPQIRKLVNSDKAILPAVSPDGKWVTFGTLTGKAWIIALNESATPVAVDSPAFEPRFYKHDDSLFVIYVTDGSNDAFVNHASATLKKFIKDGVPQGSAVTLLANAGYTSGLSRDGRYLASGTTKSYIKDLATGDTMRMHVLHEKVRGTTRDTIAMAQTCNNSISQSTVFTDAVLYLDFGNPSKDSFPGLGSWGFHQYALLSRKDGGLYKVYGIPQRDVSQRVTGSVQNYAWDGTEWSNHPYFAVVSANITRRWQEQSGTWTPLSRHEQVIIINLKDSSYITALETLDSTRSSEVDMNWPALWVKIPDNFSEDSAWLKHEIAIEKVASFPHNRIIKVRCLQDRLYADSPIKSITIYDVRGRESLRLDGHLANQMILPRSMASGVYTIRVKTVGGLVAIAKWNHQR